MKRVWLLGGYNDIGRICTELWKTQEVLQEVSTKQCLKRMHAKSAEEINVI